MDSIDVRKKLTTNERVARNMKRWRQANPERNREIQATYRNKLREQRGEPPRPTGGDRIGSGRPRKPGGKGATPRQLEMMKARNAALKDTDITKHWLLQLRGETTHCVICGLPLDGQVHLDHVEPLLEGGKHYMSNVRYVHAKCNLSRIKRPRLAP